MNQYKLFVKDCLYLNGRVKSDVRCLSFDVKRDLLEKSISTFIMEYIDNNIDEGDVCGLYDSFGMIYYIGVVDEIDKSENRITCTSNISFFKYTWIYNALREITGTTEELVKKSFEDVFINSNDYLINKKYKDINIVLETNSLNYKLPLKESNYTQSFEDFIYSCFNNFGIICDLNVPFGPYNPTLKINGSITNAEPIKIGNNFNKLRNFNVKTDTFENNKLVVYSEDGSTLRATFYGTQNGITQDDQSPLRLKKVNSVIVFSDDELNLIEAQNLQNQMFNHKITFDLLLDNSLYDFFNDFKLGMPIDIWYNGVYFNSLFTGYRFVKELDEDVSMVSIVCGKVRNSLTSKILKYAK